MSGATAVGFLRLVGVADAGAKGSAGGNAATVATGAVVTGSGAGPRGGETAGSETSSFGAWFEGADAMAWRGGVGSTAALFTRVAVLVSIAILMTIGVYGLVAGIVKLDDGAFVLARSRSRAARGLGRWILAATPWLMKGLSVAGTAAMFLVGGGILTHGVPALHHLTDGALQALDGFARTVGSLLLNGLAGFAAGLVVVAALTLIKRVRRGR